MLLLKVLKCERNSFLNFYCSSRFFLHTQRRDSNKKYHTTFLSWKNFKFLLFKIILVFFLIRHRLAINFIVSINISIVAVIKNVLFFVIQVIIIIIVNSWLWLSCLLLVLCRWWLSWIVRCCFFSEKKKLKFYQLSLKA